VIIAKADISVECITSLVMEAILSSETSFLRTATRRHIPEDGILEICFL
jgi:hypothetical protein